MSKHNQKSTIASTTSESPNENMDPGGGGEKRMDPGGGGEKRMDPGGGGECH
jgi:hypothetical protein